MNIEKKILDNNNQDGIDQVIDQDQGQNPTDEFLPEKNTPEQENLNLIENRKKVYESLPAEAKEAWHQGWRPQELFNGKNKNGTERAWVDYQDFLNRGKEMLPIANMQVQHLTRKIQELEKRNKQAEEKGYKKALEELTNKQETATENGDTEQFRKLELKKQELIEDRFKSIQKSPDESEQEIEEKSLNNNSTNQQNQKRHFSQYEAEVVRNWVAKNNWYNVDHKLQAYAIAADTQLAKDNPYLSLDERLDLVSSEVREIFPEKFSQSQGKTTVLSGSVGNSFGNSPKAKNYSDLPVDAKQICEKVIKIRSLSEEKATAYRKGYAIQYFSN